MEGILGINPEVIGCLFLFLLLSIPSFVMDFVHCAFVLSTMESSFFPPDIVPCTYCCCSSGALCSLGQQLLWLTEQVLVGFPLWVSVSFDSETIIKACAAMAKYIDTVC